MSGITFIAIGALVLVAIGASLFAINTLINPTTTAADRLAGLQQEQAPDPLLTNYDQEQEGALTFIFDRIGSLAKPASADEQLELRKRLVQAGYKNRHALEIFNGLRVSLAVGLPLLSAPFASNMSLTWLLGTVLGAAAAGYYVPWLLLESSIERRKQLLLAALPDAMDLLVSSVEAGLGIDAAFRRVAVELSDTSPELGREFQLVNHEISAGVPRIEALRHLERRTGLDEIRSLVNMLSQAERFGTSIANSLRVHSKVTRQKRMARAEEEAAKVSPKLTVIMILFLMPSLMVVLLGPAAINVMNTFNK